MSIKYEIHSIKNSKGTGKEQEFVRIFENAKFERAKFSSKSRQYTEEELLAKIKEYLTANNCITRRDLELNFGLRQSAALKCLKHFTEIGILKKEGARNSPVYFLNK